MQVFKVSERWEKLTGVVLGRTISNWKTGRTDKRPNWAASKWSGKLEAGDDRHGRKGAISKWRTTERYTRDVRTLPNKGRNLLFWVLCIMTEVNWN